MFYAPSMLSGGSQQDQQSLAGSASVSKSIRSSLTTAAQNSTQGNELYSNYLTVYPEMVEVMVPNAEAGVDAGTDAAGAAGSIGSTSGSTSAIGAAGICSTGTAPGTGRTGRHLFSRRHRRHLERQVSLDASSTLDDILSSELIRNQSDTIATTTTTTTTAAPSFLHTKAVRPQGNPRQHFMAGSAAVSSDNAANSSSSSSAVMAVAQPNTRSLRLQRHRSSETHEERLKHQSRIGLFQSMQQTLLQHQQQHFQQQQQKQLLKQQQKLQHEQQVQQLQLEQRQHAAEQQNAKSGSIGDGVDVDDVDEMELALALSRIAVNDASNRALPSWILGKAYNNNYEFFFNLMTKFNRSFPSRSICSLVRCRLFSQSLNVSH